MSLLSPVGIAATALILTFSLGYLTLRALTQLDETECWTFSGAAGSALLAAIAFAAFIFGRFDRAFYIGSTLGLLLISLLVARQRRVSLWPTRVPPWLMGGCVLWLALLCMQLMLPIYTGADFYGDWWMHFDISQFYLGLRDVDVRYFGTYNIPSRTPLFNLATSYYLATFDNSFVVCQVTSLIPGIALLAVLLPLARPKQTSVAICLVACNPFLINHILFPWPKIMAGVYTLASLYCYLHWRSVAKSPSRLYLVGWSLSSGLAILAHSSALFYILGMLIDYFWLQRRSLWRVAPHVIIAAAIMLGVMAPWLTWIAHTYGISELLRSAPTVMAMRVGVSSIQWWTDRFSAIVGTLLPIPLISWIFTRVPPQVWDAWLRLFYSVLPGTFTITLTFLTWIRLVHQRRQTTLGLPGTLIIILAVTGFMGGILLQPGRGFSGVAGESMMPLVLLFLTVAIHIAEALTPRLRRVVLALIGLEFAASRGAHTVVLALGLFSSNNANLVLKHQHHLTFAADVVGSAWPLFGGIAVVAYTVLLWSGMQVPSARARA